MYYFLPSLRLQFFLLPIPSPLKFLQQLLSRSSKITVNDNTRNLIESNLIFPIGRYNFLVYRRCMCVTKSKFGTDMTSESIHNEPYSFPCSSSAASHTGTWSAPVYSNIPAFSSFRHVSGEADHTWNVSCHSRHNSSALWKLTLKIS